MVFYYLFGDTALLYAPVHSGMRNEAMCLGLSHTAHLYKDELCPIHKPDLLNELAHIFVCIHAATPPLLKIRQQKSDASDAEKVHSGAWYR